MPVFHSRGQCLILVNNNDHGLEREITVWEIGTPQSGWMEALLWTDENGYSLERKTYEIKAGKIQIELPKTCAVILKYSNCKNDTL